MTHALLYHGVIFQVDASGLPVDGQHAFLIGKNREAHQCLVKLTKTRQKILVVVGKKARAVDMQSIAAVMEGADLDLIEEIPIKGETCVAIQTIDRHALVLLFDSVHAKQTFITGVKNLMADATYLAGTVETPQIVVCKDEPRIG